MPPVSLDHPRSNGTRADERQEVGGEGFEPTPEFAGKSRVSARRIADCIALRLHPSMRPLAAGPTTLASSPKKHLSRGVRLARKMAADWTAPQPQSASLELAEADRVPSSLRKRIGSHRKWAVAKSNANTAHGPPSLHRAGLLSPNESPSIRIVRYVASVDVV